MRWSLFGEGEGTLAVWSAAVVVMKIADDKAAAKSRPVCDPALHCGICRASVFIFFWLSRGHPGLPENSTNWRMISMSSTLSPRGQSPKAKLPDKRAPDVVVPFFDSRFEPGAELKAVLATGRGPD